MNYIPRENRSSHKEIGLQNFLCVREKIDPIGERDDLLKRITWTKLMIAKENHSCFGHLHCSLFIFYMYIYIFVPITTMGMGSGILSHLSDINVWRITISMLELGQRENSPPQSC